MAVEDMAGVGYVIAGVGIYKCAGVFVFAINIDDTRVDIDMLSLERWISWSSVMGTWGLPESAAKVIRRAIEQMIVDGDVRAENRWLAVEYMAAEYLSGVELNQEE